jgi:hypothetical protein
MRRTLSPWLWGVVVASIVLTQWLAFVHRIAHNPWVQLEHSLSYTNVDLAAKHNHGSHLHSIKSRYIDSAPSYSWLDGLFAHQDGDITCHLHDALATMDGASVAKALVYITSPAILLVAFSQILSTARAAALFEARGPPARS